MLQWNSLKSTLKQKLLSSSAKAIKVCAKFNTSHLSFVVIHDMFKRGTPDNFLLYKHALALYKIINSNDYNLEFASLNLNIILTSRQTNFISRKNNKRSVGLNALANRFHILNNRIPLAHFNKSFDTYKILCKKEFLNNWNPPQRMIN